MSSPIDTRLATVVREIAGYASDPEAFAIGLRDNPNTRAGLPEEEWRDRCKKADHEWKKGQRLPTEKAVERVEAGRNIGLFPADFGLLAVDVDRGDPDELSAGYHHYGALDSGRGPHLFYEARHDGNHGSTWGEQKGGKGEPFHGCGGDLISRSNYIVVRDAPGFLDVLKARASGPVCTPPDGLFSIGNGTGGNSEPVTSTKGRPPKPPAKRHARKALARVSPDLPYDDWVRVGMACYTTYGAGDGFELWDQWSQGGAKYSGLGEMRRKWGSFDADPDNPVKWGTVVKLAKANGYQPPPRTAAAMEDRGMGERWATDPEALAARMLNRYGDRMLVVEATNEATGWRGAGVAKTWGRPTAYLLDEASGIWDPKPQPWTPLLSDLLDGMQEEAEEELDGSALVGVKRAIGTARRSPSLDFNVREAVYTAYEGGDFEGVTVCEAPELDDKLRYLGCRNGIVDLRTGRLLDAEEGRRHLVTMTTGLDYRPDADQSEVDRLFAHLDTGDRDWLLDSVGHALHGQPSRRVYLAEGPPNAGKTTMAMAAVESLGEYGGVAMETALTGATNAGSASPEYAPFASPRRLAVMDDPTVNGLKIATPALKRLSGDAKITYRMLNENPVTKFATATLFILCNEQDVPRFNLADDAMADRLRVLKYPAVPEADRDGAFKYRARETEFLEALLARLIKCASRVTPGSPPGDIPSVADATADRIAEDIGDFGDFAKRLNPDTSGGTVSLSEVWDAWCADQGADRDAKEVGGVYRTTTFTRRLRRAVPGLGSTVTGIAYSDPKKPDDPPKHQRGWRGWRLGPPDHDEGESPF